jgi:hypothetical protein
VTFAIARPVQRVARRFGERQSHDPLGHLWAEGLNPRGPGLVAQQAVDALLGKPFLPAPDNRLALGGVAHDRHRAEPVGGGQHDPSAPDVLLWAVAVRHDGFEAITFSGGHFYDDPSAHHPDSHVESPMGIHFRTRPSRSIH